MATVGGDRVECLAATESTNDPAESDEDDVSGVATASVTFDGVLKGLTAEYRAIVGYVAASTEELKAYDDLNAFKADLISDYGKQTGQSLRSGGYDFF